MDIHQEFTDRIRPTVDKPHVDLPFKPNINSCQEWSDSLPILNPQTTAEMMSDAAQGLLSIDIDGIKKFDLLETIKPVITKLLSTCIEATENANLPLINKLSELSSTTLQVLSNTLSVYIEIACSPNFVIEDTPKRKVGSKKLLSSKQKAIVLHRSIELLGMIQLLKSLLYVQVGNIFWNETNALFSLAEKLNLHQNQQVAFNGNTTTIEDEFKKIHFFHLAQPNRFRQRDINTIQRILSLHVGNISISHVHEKLAGFYIDLSSSSGISIVPDLLSDNGHYRFLNNGELVSFLQSNQVIAPEKQSSISLVSDNPILPKQTINQLLPSWSIPKNRKTPRHDQTEEILVYPGFDSILKALILKKNPDYFNKENILNSFDIENLDLVPLDEHQQSKSLASEFDIHRAFKATAKKPPSSNDIWENKSSIKHGEKGETMEAESSNASLQGLCFQVSTDNKPLLRANDLIGTQSKNGTLHLAIIRRLNRDKNGDITVGVEVMSATPKIAYITFHDKERSPVPAIFIQGAPSDKQSDSIITPLLLKGMYENITIKLTDKTNNYRIDSILETNLIFTRYNVLKLADID